MRFFASLNDFVVGCKFNRLAVALLVLLTLPLLAHGQSSEGTVLGTVTDPSGAVMPNVNVTITNALTGGSKNTDHQ